jgi:hypothetical protein
MHRVSVVIPALNEAGNLPHVEIRIVQQQGPGKGSALRTGFSAATGEII